MSPICLAGLVLGSCLSDADFLIKSSRCRGGLASREVRERAINMAMARLAVRVKVQGGYIIGRTQESLFLRKGWPVLRDWAGESGMSVAEMLEDSLTLHDLYVSSHPLLVTRFPAIIAEMKQFRIDLASLEQIDVDGKMNAKSWDRVRRIMAGLFGLRTLVFLADVEHDRHDLTDPIAKLDAQAIEGLLDGLDRLSLDSIQQMLELRPSEASPLGDSTGTGTGPTEVGNDEPQPAAVAIPADPVRQTSPPLPEVDSLLDLLSSGAPPRSDNWVYLATTPAKRNLRVYFSRKMADAMTDRRTGQPARRLVASILTGRTSSGIKMLNDIGSNVIELRARMRGPHFRVFGCLKGDDLHLLYLEDIKADRGTYSRRIPRDLCLP